MSDVGDVSHVGDVDHGDDGDDGATGTPSGDDNLPEAVSQRAPAEL